jgi:hypothetical protein
LHRCLDNRHKVVVSQQEQLEPCKAYNHYWASLKEDKSLKVEWVDSKTTIKEELKVHTEVAIRSKITIRIITKVLNKIQINHSWVLELEECNHNQIYSKI